MFVYIISSDVFLRDNCYKIGITKNPRERLATYLTGCPPNLPISADLRFLKIFKTRASCEDDLRDYEELIHNRFISNRLFRKIFGDSEWFRLSAEEYFDVCEFIMNSDWFDSEVELEDIKKTLGEKQLKPYRTNPKIIKCAEKRLEVLNELQRPIIDKIIDFYKSKLAAGYLIAPCGFGKTITTLKSILELKLNKVIICCPSKQIIKQWRETIIAIGLFRADEIFIIAQESTTSTRDKTKITDYFKLNRFCIISTYMSCNLLVDFIEPYNLQLIINDEAHHLSGVVASEKEEEGLGITRKLVMRSVELGIKRLSLTYTPKIINRESSISEDKKVISMEDTEIFGEEIANISLRTLIDKGVLPDYKIWNLMDEKCVASGILAKMECILNVWNSKEYYRGIERYTLRHLIIFVATIEDSKTLESYLETFTDTILEDTEIYRVEGGNSGNDEVIRRFRKSSRGIIINCKVLNEGVDIPEANCVAILYPKYSKIEITQMILRAGRWHTDKNLFHILFPITREEDLGGMEEVLISLASADETLKEEIENLCLTIGKKKEDEKDLEVKCEKLNGFIIDDYSADHIMIECIDGFDTSRLKDSFKTTCGKIRDYRERNIILELCRKEGVNTSLNYKKLQEANSFLPEDPRKKGETWFDFLNPSVIKIDIREFVNEICVKNNILDAKSYMEFSKNPISIQNILDGYYGDETNFNSIMIKYRVLKRASRR